MWPRPDGRGNAGKAAIILSVNQLQCGRALTDAEILPLAKSPTHCFPLQCGRALTDAEMVAAVAFTQPLGTASMWPRPDGRGNDGVEYRVGDRVPASMWPRPDGRGNVVEVAVRRADRRLQCGRALTDAE